MVHNDTQTCKYVTWKIMTNIFKHFINDVNARADFIMSSLTSCFCFEKERKDCLNSSLERWMQPKLLTIISSN